MSGMGAEYTGERVTVPLLKAPGIAPAAANNYGEVARDVNDSCWLDAAATAVDQQINLASKGRGNLLRIGQWEVIAGQQERGTHQWLTKYFEQCEGHWMIRDADANGLPLRILQATRHLPRCFENEGIGSWRVRLQQAIAPVLHTGIRGNLGEVPAHDGEVVVLARLANPLQSASSFPIAEVPAKCIAGIGWVDHQAVASKNIHRLLDQPALGIHRMDMKALGHGLILAAHPRLPRGRRDAYHVQTSTSGIPFMQFVVDFLPLLAFAVAYWLADMHTAILAIMVAISLQVLITWLVKRTVSRMLLASAALVDIPAGDPGVRANTFPLYGT